MTILRFIYSFLRGNIPGGPWVLLFLLGMFTFILWYIVQTSGLLERQRARHILIQGWIILIVGYFIIWMATKPEPLPKTLLVTPFADETQEKWIGEAMADQLGERLWLSNKRILWLPWEVCQNICYDLPPDSTWKIIKEIQPTFAIWGKLWGREDSLWVESHYARTRLGRTLHFPEHIRRYKTIEDAVSVLADLTRTSTLIPQLTESNQPTDFPTSAMRYHYAGLRQFRKGRHNVALDLAMQAINIDSTWDKPWCLVGRCWDVLEDSSARAMYAFRRAIELDSSDVDNWQNLAKCSIRRGQWDNAERSLKIAYQLKRKNPITLFLMSHMNKDRLARFSNLTPDQALEKAVALHPSYQEARLKLARNYYAVGNLRKCKKLVQDGLELYPQSWEFWQILSNIDIRLGKLDQALEEIRLSLIIAGDHPSVLYNVGLVYFHLDSLKQAKEYLSRSAEIGASSDTYYLLGQCTERQGDSTAALFYYQMCVQSASGSDDRSAQEANKKILELKQR